MMADIRKALVGKRAQQAKRAVLGQHHNDGWLAKLFIYFMLSIVAYLYLQPFFYMVSTMFKNLSDLLDPTVQWIPRKLEWNNLVRAWNGLKYPQSFANTITIALFGSLIQVCVCALTGYALAKLKFPGKGLAQFLVFLTFLVPPQIIIIPLYVIFSKLGWLNTPLVFLVPALFGQGLRSALFIIIFRQFFKTLPDALEEAAKLDGASTFRIFSRIMMPLARSACLVVFLFSFIWYWNQYYEPSMFLNNAYQPLSIRLNQLPQVLMGTNPDPSAQLFNPITEGTKMAGAFLIVFPPLLVYIVTQRWFVEGIERTGLVD
ncbi:carbohydrate ABC transporter permease [Paenibacillus sp. HJGM_3]|uniref:carbohydrate ABC transporter permease n=1 Tax=Paenibacillus sp. HJGM_3 TaxID=3379816 RepID=UPI0038584FC4